MLTLLVFLAILSLLVLVHELGHFLAAKRSGVRVEEFGLGLPPKLFSKKVGETVFSFNLLPFGGFVKLTGEDGLEDGASPEAEADPRSFASKKPLARAFMLSAGILFNILLAFVLYYFLFFFTGFKSPTIPLYFDYGFRFGETRKVATVVTAMEEGSPAFNAGIQVGEGIIEIDDKAVYNVAGVREALAGKEGQETRLLLIDMKTLEQTPRVVTVKPTLNEEGRAQLGVLLGPAVTIFYDKPVQKVFAGPMHAYNMTAYTFRILGGVVSSAIQTRDTSVVSQTVSGPVGIFSVVGVILDVKGREAFLGLLDFTALLSLSLGIMNVLPFPALDGGRLVFVLLEIVRGKKVHPLKEAMFHRIGMAILLAMIFLITFKDIRNLIG